MSTVNPQGCLKDRLSVMPDCIIETPWRAALLHTSALAGVVYLGLIATSSAADSAAQLNEAPAAQNGRGAANSSETSSLEEIVVTAQKRRERLIDTPQSVTALFADDLAKLGAVQFRDIANTVPGLDFTTAGAGNTQITIRGVTTGYDISPTVGIYVDDVPYGSSTTFAQASQLGLDVGLFDLNRIEILRGPQGTLYGASTMGGLIKYVTKQPDADSFGGDAQAGVSGTEHGGVNFDVAGAVNVPVVADKVAVRAGGFESRDGGYIDNVALNQKDANRSDVYGGRLDVLITPTDALSIRLTGFAQDIDRAGEGTALYTSAGRPVYGSLDQYRLFAEPFNEQFRLVSGTVSYDFGPVTLTSISSYQTVRENNTWDVSAVYVPFLNSDGFGPYSATGVAVANNTNKFTEELRLAGNATDVLEWLVGGFYTHEDTSENEVFLLRDLSGNPAPNNLLKYINPSTYEEASAFGDLTWHITDKFDITGGLRYADNNQTSKQIGSGVLVIPAQGSSSQSVVTYLADARYHFNNHTTAYVRYATGYRPGGPDFSLRDPLTGAPQGPTSFNSDTLASYEGGIKTETTDRRYSLDLAVYDIEWSNIQLAKIINGLEAVVNAPGGASIQGGELTFTARPTSDLTFAGAFAYQNAYLDHADLDLGAAKGERLPGTPRFTATLNGDYELPVESDLQPTIGATFRYVGDRMVSFNGNPSQYHLPAYTNFDLRGEIAVNAVAVQVYVHNLFDTRGQLGNVIPSFGTRIAIEQPRTVGVQVSWKF